MCPWICEAAWPSKYAMNHTMLRQMKSPIRLRNTSIFPTMVYTTSVVSQQRLYNDLLS